MCVYLIQPVETAVEDMTVYKVVVGHLFPVTGMRYRSQFVPGQRHPQNDGSTGSVYWYDVGETVCSPFESTYGFYTCDSLRLALDMQAPYETILKCTIPAGTSFKRAHWTLEAPEPHVVLCEVLYVDAVVATPAKDY